VFLIINIKSVLDNGKGNLNVNIGQVISPDNYIHVLYQASLITLLYVILELNLYLLCFSHKVLNRNTLILYYTILYCVKKSDSFVLLCVLTDVFIVVVCIVKNPDVVTVHPRAMFIPREGWTFLSAGECL